MWYISVDLMEMDNKLIEILVDPDTKRKLNKKGKYFYGSKKRRYEIVDGVPVFTKLDPYLEVEAAAWEDEWQKGVSKKALRVYKKNLKVFRKLGYWEESAEAAEFIHSDKTYSVLDIGCGNGVSTTNITGKFVVGVELSQKQMVRAKKRFKNTNFVVADARKLPFKSNTFDLIVAINLLHHVADPESILKESYRVLKKGGRLLTVDPNLYNPIGYIGRGLYRLLKLKKIFPTFPQFALGEDERQFTKTEYRTLFKRSPFKNWEIKPHRLERLLFFATILFPSLYKIPFYEQALIVASKYGNKLVQTPPFDWICYFWKAKAIK